MTDKQIIIDGIDVSGCSYFKMNNKMPLCRACNSGVGSPYCEYHKDCYYKQLIRAEQKLEKIKKFLIENVCLEDENCLFCDNQGCINKDVLKIIEE